MPPWLLFAAAFGASLLAAAAWTWAADPRDSASAGIRRDALLLLVFGPPAWALLASCALILAGFLWGWPTWPGVPPGAPLAHPLIRP